jgi:integrase
VSEAEVAAICAQLGWDCTGAPEQIKHYIAWSLAFAVETAMRKGEILGMTWGDVYLVERYIHLPRTKNGDARDVPLSSRALALLRLLNQRGPSDTVAPVHPGTFDTMFRGAVRKAGIEDLRFHDSRHEAITRLARRLSNVLELSAVSGHRSLKMLQRYYHPDVGELAGKLG